MRKTGKQVICSQRDRISDILSSNIPMRPKATPPKPGQESVWDYPRPPRLEESDRHVLVTYQGTPIAESRRALRVLETSHPPTYYIPPEDIEMNALIPVKGTTICEWKGQASYFDLSIQDETISRVAWVYPDPMPAFNALQGHLAFYPHKVECFLDDERVQAQAGGFYGGWITRDIVGPFKGEPGTTFW
jgi:uncharacterized protein (DUF427 family)